MSRLNRTKIFVTVGTCEMDMLVKSVDTQVGDGKIFGDVVVQTGNGSYIPKNIRHYTIANHMTHMRGMEWADVVICTGGAATLVEALSREKSVVIVWMRPWSKELAKPWVEGNHVLYCENLADLPVMIDRARTHKFNRWIPDQFDIAPIMTLLESTSVDSLHPVERTCVVISLSCTIILLLIAATIILSGVFLGG